MMMAMVAAEILAKAVAQSKLFICRFLEEPYRRNAPPFL